MVLVLIYLGLGIRTNIIKKVKIELNNSDLQLKIGDILNEDGYKIIEFNEYFDTRVDNKIISSKTLNGKYIKKKLMMLVN